MSGFNGATLLITGGTGSFGNTVLKHFLESDIREIRIFSRDERKFRKKSCHNYHPNAEVRSPFLRVTSKQLI